MWHNMPAIGRLCERAILMDRMAGLFKTVRRTQVISTQHLNSGLELRPSEDGRDIGEGTGRRHCPFARGARGRPEMVSVAEYRRGHPNVLSNTDGIRRRQIRLHQSCRSLYVSNEEGV